MNLKLKYLLLFLWIICGIGLIGLILYVDDMSVEQIFIYGIFCFGYALTGNLVADKLFSGID